MDRETCGFDGTRGYQEKQGSFSDEAQIEFQKGSWSRGRFYALGVYERKRQRPKRFQKEGLEDQIPNCTVLSGIDFSSWGRSRMS